MAIASPGSDESPRGRPRNPALDGLRALAVAAVVYRHLELPGLPGGGIGVLIFFTLSGFIITLLMCAERDRTGRVTLGAFWARRARRLLPALGVCIALSAALAATVGVGLATTAREAAPALLYVSNWWRVWVAGHPDVPGLGPFEHTWSLSIEEQFYLGWPLLFLVLHRYLGHRPLALVTVILGLAELSALDRALSWNATDPAGSANLVYNRTDTEAELLLIGAAAGVLTWLITRDGAPRLRLPRWALPVAGAAGLLVVTAALLGQPGPAHPARMHLFWTLGLTAVALGVAAVCTLVLVHPRTAVSRVLAAAPLPQLGRISYGVYLFHYPLVIYLLPQFADAPTLGRVIVVAATLAVSAASWRWVERPVLTRRWERVRR